MNRKIQFIKGVGPKKAELLNKLDIFTVEDMLSFYPRAYDDWNNICDIKELVLDDYNVIRARLDCPVSDRRITGGTMISKFVACDDSGKIIITYFNNKFISKMLHEGEEYFFKGKVHRGSNGKEMTAPEFIPVSKTPSIFPIYNLTHGITSKQISTIVKSCLSLYDESDPIPDYIRNKYKLCTKSYALNKIHFPQSFDEVLIARRRLIFEELLILQLGMSRIKNNNKAITTNVLRNDYFEEFKNLLSFTLTNAQARAIDTCTQAMRKNEAMNVLLQGDVGSGKTAVAGALCYSMAKNKMQCAMMAPTEILANQHYHSLSNLLKNTGLKVELLTGSLTKKKKLELYARLEQGEIDLLVGTHALISEGVVFKNLALVITDEQHRFGVKQRSALAQKGNSPHTLVMSATPIPRTLALMIYGDLDLVVLDELPAGRQKIETYTINSQIRKRAFNYIQKHIDEGRQAYIICPLIEQGESERANIETYFEFLKGHFDENLIAVLHGKMKPKEKDAVMESFANDEKKILLATTVVEVGVDVPNAVIMLIENAEMYGLSQLHQLRGRVGRGEHKSTCILLTDAQNEECTTRMRLMCGTSDGFKIADADLKMRGPGDFFGKKQHGLPCLKIADMANDMETLREVQECSLEMKNAGFKLSENEELFTQVKRLFSSIGNEDNVVI